MEDGERDEQNQRGGEAVPKRAFLGACDIYSITHALFLPRFVGVPFLCNGPRPTSLLILASILVRSRSWVIARFHRDSCQHI
jgi:hypothetical protein